jgi:predicted dehydrogenase
VIRVAVIGATEPARQHARAFDALPHACSLTGVYESAAVDEALEHADALVVASEPDLHFHHVAMALEHGLDVLVEQPVATSIDNARMLERIASLRPSEPVLQPSNVDHFNPALRTLADLLAQAEPVAIDVRRLVADADAAASGLLLDVQTLVSLAGSALVRLQAAGGRDYTTATLVFENGLIGTLASGVVGFGPAHRVVATTSEATISVDALGGTVEDTRGDVCERTQVPVGDTYAAQAANFLQSVRERARPALGLRSAIASIEVADGVRECLAVQAAATGTGGVRAH